MVEARYHLSGQLLTRARHLHGEVSAMCHEHGTLTADDVHRVRVMTKELRALWQLLKPLDMPQGDGADKDLAHAAATLAAARDATVIPATLRDLARHAPRKSERHLFTDALQCLFPDPQPVEVEVPPSLLETMAADARRWHSIQADIDDQALITKGVRRSWRKIRNRILTAMDSDGVRQWHALRKWVKYLSIQMALLEQAGLKSPLSLADSRRLARDLGHLHDVHVLIRYVDAHRDAFSDDDAGYCLHLLRNHEARMLDACRSHAAHLTQIKPRQLRKTLLEQLS